MSPLQQMASPEARHPDKRLDGVLVLVDADNTLWDTDGVFARAQVALLSSVEDALATSGPVEGRLNYVRNFDQALAESHHLGLRYPPRLLVNALALSLQGFPKQDAVRRAWSDGSKSGLTPEAISQIEQTFFDMIATQPNLLEGVLAGLGDLASAGAKTIVLTEGNRERVVRTIEYHGLNRYIERIFEAPKTSRMFKRVSRLAKNAQTIYMIGDQLTRDIRPASEAGLKTIYIPSAFQPRWEQQAGNIATFEAATFDAAISALIR